MQNKNDCCCYCFEMNFSSVFSFLNLKTLATDRSIEDNICSIIFLYDFDNCYLKALLKTASTSSLPGKYCYYFIILLFVQVQEVPNDDYEEQRVFLGPILHISCSLDIELQEPALIRIPITLQQDQIKLPDLSSSHVRIFYRNKKDKSKEWVEITRQLKMKAQIENGVVTFQVNHLCE